MTIATITITLPIEGGDTATNQEVLDALQALADVMLVQAEDGLYRLGSKEASDLYNDAGTEVEVENTYLRGIGSGQRVAVTVAPHDALMAALVQAGRAAYGDSNDDELFALNDALDEALSLLGVMRPDVDVDDEEED